MRQDFDSKLILGGATFGNTYGVTNSGNPDNKEASEIIKAALADVFIGVDTAPAYGDSEKVLGDQNLEKYEVYTKISNQQLHTNVRDARREVEKSLSRLGVKKLTGLTFHSSMDFLGDPIKSVELIEDLYESALIEKWGVSLYTPNEIEPILEIMAPDYFQAPVNLLDRRFISGRGAILMKENNVELQARSLFLQGILLENPSNLPPYFSPWMSLIERYHYLSNTLGLSMLSLSLNTVLQSEYLQRAVVGVNTMAQLLEILKALQSQKLDLPTELFPECTDEALIDPRKWRS